MQPLTEDVASSGLVRRSKPWLLILAGVVFFLFVLVPAMFGGPASRGSDSGGVIAIGVGTVLLSGRQHATPKPGPRRGLERDSR